MAYLDKVAGDIATGNVNALRQVREGETLKDRDNMGHTIT